MQWRQYFQDYRHLPVCQYFHPHFSAALLKYGTAFFTQTYFSGERKQPHPIFTKRRQVHTQLNTFIKENSLRHLDHDAGTITLNCFHNRRHPVLPCSPARYAHQKYSGGFVALNIGYKTNTAGIVFIRRMIKPFILFLFCFEYHFC